MGFQNSRLGPPNGGSVQSGHFSFKSMVPFDVKIGLSGRSSIFVFFDALISSNAENRKPLSFFTSKGFLYVLMLKIESRFRFSALRGPYKF